MARPSLAVISCALPLHPSRLSLTFAGGFLLRSVSNILSVTLMSANPPLLPMNHPILGIQANVPRIPVHSAPCGSLTPFPLHILLRLGIQDLDTRVLVLGITLDRSQSLVSAVERGIPGESCTLQVIPAHTSMFWESF